MQNGNRDDHIAQSYSRKQKQTQTQKQGDELMIIRQFQSTVGNAIPQRAEHLDAAWEKAHTFSHNYEGMSMNIHLWTRLINTSERGFVIQFLAASSPVPASVRIVSAVATNAFMAIAETLTEQAEELNPSGDYRQYICAIYDDQSTNHRAIVRVIETDHLRVEELLFDPREVFAWVDEDEFTRLTASASIG